MHACDVVYVHGLVTVIQKLLMSLRKVSESRKQCENTALNERILYCGWNNALVVLTI